MKDLKEILENHLRWLKGEDEGKRANLYGADLSGADMSVANLYGANLSGANLCGARNISSVLWDCNTAFYQIQCPESGSFIGWKKASNKIVKLEITENAKRSSATSRKCRCSEAKVLEIQNIDGSIYEAGVVSSNYRKDFEYKVGEIVRVENFDEDRWKECTFGIHFFITREEAVKYN